MKYNDINPEKKAFIFELDNVLYPEKDYAYQVYYLFAALLEYTGFADAKEATSLMVNTYDTDGHAKVFSRLHQDLGIAEKYREKLEEMFITAHLPLKLLLYQNMLTLLQEIIVDRKKVFIVTNGNPQQQLNKIKQTEWHGLEQYLVAYFADETFPKPEPDAIYKLMKDHNLLRKDLLMIGNSNEDQLCSEVCGIDYINAADFL